MVATCLAALGLGVYLGLPRVQGAPAWRRGTRSLRVANRTKAAGAGGPAAAGVKARPAESDASDTARAQTAERKKFLRRRVNPLDLLRLDERGSARRRTRRPFQLSPDRPTEPAPPASDGKEQGSRPSSAEP